MESKEDYEKAQFIQLIISLQGSAWMLLGKVMNPLTGNIEKNLEQAKITIDMIQMLKSKTKGNLSKEEENILNSVLQQLQLNYVDEVNKAPDSENTTKGEKEEEIKKSSEKKTEEAANGRDEQKPKEKKGKKKKSD
ncbi:DUF1844 domain-containing protein [Candidatus Woesearchaeota archaeon]|nr:DUF1844 domain-containing protein [Candidatus Woesearchaeota archaeon]